MMKAVALLMGMATPAGTGSVLLWVGQAPPQLHFTPKPYFLTIFLLSFLQRTVYIYVMGKILWGSLNLYIC